MSGGIRCRNQMSAIAYLWTIELENNGAGWFRESWRIFIICVERAPCKVRFLDAACTVFVLAAEELSTYYA